ncbi:MAG TPA: efflux RND transporter permease subunit [Pseudomonadales bacterium]|nr:efflux RND transporter permease subunit [Pseudomonadales bacterium]
MKNIGQWSIENSLYPWMIVFACLAGGIYGIDNVGRLEDPAFPISNAYIITMYPGASAMEVEQEVTDVIESALQELPYLDTVTSKSVQGRSEVQVEMLEKFSDDDLPQIWDELRRRISEARNRLPPGAGVPIVEDDFGDVYGVLYAITAPGYSAANIYDMSRRLSTRLKLVPGVAKVSTAGEPFEAIFVEVDHERLVRLGIPIDSIFASIAQENQVIDAGSVAYGSRRISIAPRLAFDSVQAIGDMRIGRPGSTEVLRLSDIAVISRGQVEVPPQIIRFNGESAFTVGVSVTPGLNVVKVGQLIDEQMQHLLEELPLGVEAHPIYLQHEVVSDAIDTFLRNLLLSVATVIGALCIFMGWRAGTVVGSILLLTVLGTIFVMSILNIELQRISLGALMIAMGMLVDNAIVVAEGMVIGVQRGLTAKKAASESVQRTQYALLGATIIGILAFAPIGLSEDNTGHFLVSLCQVVAISLMLSWVLAITVAPLLGSYLLRTTVDGRDDHLYQGWGYAPYRKLVEVSLRQAWFATLVIVGITAACFWGFGKVKQSFFPTTNTPLFFIDFYLPQGTDVLTTGREIRSIEDEVRKEPGVVDISSFIGRGTTRFAAMVQPEQPNSAYAHLIVRVEDVDVMNDMMISVGDRLRKSNLEAELQIRRSEFSPSGSSKVEARFTGPDPDVLRSLSAQALDVYLAHNFIDRKTNWRQRELQIVPQFNNTRARSAGVMRTDVYQSLAFATLGVNIGLYREADKLLPIIARAPAHERIDLWGLSDRTVWSPAQQSHIPMSQVVDGFELLPEDSLIFRRNRERMISALSNPPQGQNFTRAFETMRGDVEAIALPPGYHLEWGGEYEGSQEARETLGTRIPITFALMFFVTILMFGKLRQPIVIWLTVPMTVCGVVISLLVTDLSFTFPSFLGFLSLSGMLIKNCVVLVDEIDKQVEERGMTIESIVSASVSRLRPVMLAAGTTIAGMSPLLSDAFFREMAVCIMGGLAFATLLTLIALPVFYRIAFSGQIVRAKLLTPAPSGL